MFSSAYQDVAQRVNVARSLTPAAVLDAFDALKQSTRAFFASQASRNSSPTSSATVSTRLDASDVEVNMFMVAPHSSGAAIVASVGLRHGPPTYPSHLQQSLSLLRGNTSVFLPSINMSSSNTMNATLDLSIDDEAPQSDASTGSTLWPTVRPCVTSPSATDDAPKRNKVSVGVQASFLCCWSPSPSPLSSDSDPSFECYTPPSANVEACGLPIPHVANPGALPSLDVPLTVSLESMPSEAGEKLQKLEENLNALEMWKQTEEAALHTRPHSPQLASDTVAHPAHPANGGDLAADAERFCTVPCDATAAADGSLPVPVDHEPIQAASSLVPTEANSDSSTDTVEAAADDKDEDNADSTEREVLYFDNPHTHTRYKVCGVMGEGGFARVVEVEDVCRRRFAVKVHHKKVVYRSPQMREGLLREMHVMSASAGNDEVGRLVPLVESWENGEDIFFVMPLYRATLWDYLDYKSSTGYKDPNSERYYCAEMVAAVAQLHDRGVMHRDIKPENFLLDVDGGCALADFGLALSSSGRAGIKKLHCKDRCGTRDYLAPEQWRRPWYDYKIDIWQLGCVWIELFAGLTEGWMSTLEEGLFDSSNSDTMVNYRLQESIQELLPNHEALDLLVRMTEADPKKRPTVEEVMAHKYFHGLNWRYVVYGPSHEHHFLPSYDRELRQLSPRYSTFDAVNHRSLLLRHCDDMPLDEFEDELNAIRNMRVQMNEYHQEPYAFVYPPRAREA